MPTVSATFPEIFLSHGANRQIIDNGDFLIWERGQGVQPSDSAGQPDRWAWYTDSVGAEIRLHGASIGLADRPKETHTERAMEVECETWGTAGTKSQMSQKYYDVRFGGGDVCSIALAVKPFDRDMPISIIIDQDFGVGGSPEVTTTLDPQTAPAGKWSRLVWVFNLPSVAGKTLSSYQPNYLKIMIEFPPMTDTEKIRFTGVQFNTGGAALPFYSRGSMNELTKALAFREKVELEDNGDFAVGVMTTVDTGTCMFPLTYKVNGVRNVYNEGVDRFELHVGGTTNDLTNIYIGATFKGGCFMQFRSIGLSRTIGEGCLIKAKSGGAWIDFGQEVL